MKPDDAAINPKTEVKRVPWNTAWGLIYAVIIFFGAQIVAGLIISLYPVFRGWSAEQTTTWLTEVVTAQFAYVVVVEALTVAAIVIFIRAYKGSLSLIGLVRPRLRDAGYAILAYPIYLAVYIGAFVVISNFVPGIDVNQEQDVGFNQVQGGLALIMTFISLVILPPIVEEIIMRGFIFSSLRKHLNFIVTALITSVIFGILHLAGGVAGSGLLYIAAVDTLLLSFVLCYLREKTGSLWAPISLHAIKNGIAFLSLYVFIG